MTAPADTRPALCLIRACELHAHDDRWLRPSSPAPVYAAADRVAA